MKKKMLIGLCAIASATTTLAQTKAPFRLEKTWEVTGLNNPESIALDVNRKVLYISNVNVNTSFSDTDGNGYISKVDLNGKIIKQKWIEGLNAPKGLALHNGKLYIADNSELVVADVTSSKIIHKYKAVGAAFLNDVAVADNGDVYVSNTFGGSKIYRLRKGKLSLWLDSPQLNSPNGLILDKTNLLAATWGDVTNAETFETTIPGRVLKIDLDTKAISDASGKSIGNLDGYVKTIHGHLVSDWIAGKLIYLNDKNELVDDNVITLSKGTADIEFNRTDKVVYIPLMLDNKIVAYRFVPPPVN